MPIGMNFERTPNMSELNETNREKHITIKSYYPCIDMQSNIPMTIPM